MKNQMLLRVFCHALALAMASAAAYAAGPNGDVPHLPAAPYGGTFKNDNTTVTLSVDYTIPGENYNGTVSRGDNQYPIRAAVKNGKLEGSFYDKSNNAFEFTAEVDGTTMRFTTGGNTLVLKSPPVNPLAGPANTPPGLAPSGAKGGDIVGKWTLSGDLGGNKYTLTLDANHDILIEDSTGSSISGPTYTYADGKLVFSGSSTVNDLAIGGTWTISWSSENEFTTTDGNGKKLDFRRVAPAH